MVRTLDLWSRGRGFNSRSGRYQVVSTWMGDCLWTGKPSQYITNHQGQLSLPSLRGRWIKYRPAWLGLRWGTFTCVGWQVTLCDPIWQVTLHSSVMGFQSTKIYAPLPFLHLIYLPNNYQINILQENARGSTCQSSQKREKFYQYINVLYSVWQITSLCYSSRWWLHLADETL